MPITERTSKIIWGQCAARCCLCKCEVLHEEKGRITSLVGEVAHIVGERKKAARGTSNLSPAERNEPDNLLLLCRKHHKIIDDDPNTYPVELLLQAKTAHIDWVSESLVKVQPWRSSLSQLCYINVPRLCEQSELQGYNVDLSQYRDNQTLHSLRWELNHVMSSFQTVLTHLSFNAAPIQNIALHEGFIGSPISFDRQRFRTKNILINLDSADVTSHQFDGNLAKDPHIYAQIGDFRIVLFIDQRWITTSTAFTLFRPSSGQSTFSGLGIVTGIDYEARIITASAWVIGLPNGLLEIALEGKNPTTAPAAIPASSLDTLVDIDRARHNKVYFQPPPEQCDLCRKSLSQEKYMIDGKVDDLGGWACMCASCFEKRGRKIAWGHGQLYMKDSKGWLEVAGFPP